MNKWYVVGKIGGFIGSVKTMVLLGVGFVGGCLLMDSHSSKKEQNTGPRHGDPIYKEGWWNGYSCGRQSAREDENNDRDE